MHNFFAEVVVINLFYPSISYLKAFFKVKKAILLQIVLQNVKKMFKIVKKRAKRG